MAHFVYPAANPQPATAYPTVQTAYVAAAPQAAYATAAPRAAQAYDSYQTAHATPQYAYTTRTQVAVTPAATYDQKAYYQPAAQAAATYSAAEPHYQPAAGEGMAMYGSVAAKPVYTTGTTYNAAQRTAVAVSKVQPVQASSASTYVYPAAQTSQPATTYTTTSYIPAAATTTATNTYTSKGYDAALYSAATTYYQQQQASKVTGNWQAKKQGQQGKAKPKIPPKQPQLHYCDVCKISCAGPQTYREHLEGQKHKKKEAAMKAGNAVQPTGRGGQNQLRCELCDVTCTGTDAYAAHIRGAKHQKVLKLHTRLGKPIPSTDPVVVTPTASSTSTTAKTPTATTAAAKPVAKPTPTTQSIAAATATKKVLATPKITFVGGTTLKTTGNKAEEVKVETKTEPTPSNTSVSSDDLKDDDEDALNILGEKDVTPVGHEYIEEVRNEQGKTISFNCKLCECKFNDPNAKEMHMKGRRHRLQYKKKVDPSLQVEVKPSIRMRKIQEEKLRRQAQKEEFWRRREQEQRWREEMRMEDHMMWEERRRFEEMEYYNWHGHGHPGMPPPRGMPFGGPGPHMLKRPDSSDDRHVMAKHASIYPNEAELQAVQNIVSSCEKALKHVSDFLAESDAPKKMEVDSKEAVKKEIEKKEGEKKDDGPSSRTLKGVMRVGVLAKGLLLHGDLNVRLVVLCSEKPTRTLLERVADNLPKQLAVLAENQKSEGKSVVPDNYEVKRCVEEAAIIVTNEKEPKATCTITLTSPVMRESVLAEGGTFLYFLTVVTKLFFLQNFRIKKFQNFIKHLLFRPIFVEWSCCIYIFITCINNSLYSKKKKNNIYRVSCNKSEINMLSYQGLLAITLLFALCISVSEAYDCNVAKIKAAIKSKPYNCYNDLVLKSQSCHKLCFEISDKENSEKYYCPWGDRKDLSSCSSIKKSECDSKCKKDPGTNKKLEIIQTDCCGTCIKKCGEVFKPQANKKYEDMRPKNTK